MFSTLRTRQAQLTKITPFTFLLRSVALVFLSLILIVQPSAANSDQSDWLIDPSPFVSEVIITEDQSEITLTNGLVERSITTIPSSSTASFRNLTTGEEFIRALGPEGFVTIDGHQYPLGGVTGQPVQNYFKPAWLSNMKPIENSYRFSSVKVEEIQERFPWKKRTEWLSRDLSWPPRGKHVIMTYRPPVPTANQFEKSTFGPKVWEETFSKPLGEEWTVFVSKSSDRTSVSNEGKPGEIYALENACAFIEHPWPKDARAISVTLDTGDDEVSNSWGPGLALLYGNQTICVTARPNSQQYELSVGGQEQLVGSFDRTKAVTIVVRLASELTYIFAEQEGNSHLLRTLPSADVPKSFRVGKIGKHGAGEDCGTTGSSLFRSHLINVTCFASPDITAMLASAQNEGQTSTLPEIDVHYEIYDGLPLIGKWLVVRNTTAQQIEVNTFTSEQLYLAEPASTVDGKPGDQKFNLAVISNYVFGGMAESISNSKAAKFLPDPTYRTQVNYMCQELTLLRCAPDLGPEQTVEPGQTFESFRIYELLYDSTDRERQGLAYRRMFRTLAPWTAENPLMFHKTTSRPDQIRAAIDQCRETGFELIIMSFGSGFNLESTNPEYIQQYKELSEQAQSAGIALGGYSLTSSRGAGTREDNVQTPSPRFGVGPCLGSKWGIEYLQKLQSFMSTAGFGVFENDGPYPGDECNSNQHPGHKGIGDSVWVQWQAQSNLYKFCRANGIYVNQPDGYFLNGGNKTGMGYRETNWSLPRAEQVIIERQNIYDGTWTKATSMGWMFVPLSQYHGGGEAATIEPLKDHLDHYDARLANLIGSGVQACYRGPRLFDSPETLAVVKKWVTFFKTHRQVLDGDLIHLRRANGRDWDGWLNVNPQGEQKGLAFFFNPLTEPIEREITVPLYYTGLRTSAKVSVNGQTPVSIPLDETRSAKLKLTLPPEGYVWVLFSADEQIQQNK